MGKLFSVKTDHKTSYISRILRFQSWSIGESYFQSSVFSSITSRGVQNVVADGLTRVMSLSSVEISSNRHMFIDTRIFRFGGDNDSRKARRQWGGSSRVEDLGEVEKRGIFAIPQFYRPGSGPLWRPYLWEVMAGLVCVETSLGWFPIFLFAKNWSVNVNRIGRTRLIIIFIIWML